MAAGVLRLAIGLDRSHARLVDEVRVDDRRQEVVIGAVPRTADADLSLELFAARERSGLLADVLGVPVSVEAGPVAAAS